MTNVEQWDAAIVGAGPAGATAALHLARRGYRVVLIDRHRFPRDKVCGDALIPDTIHCLERAGLYDLVRSHAREITMATVYSPGRFDFDVTAPLLTLKRVVFDRLLTAQAIDAGAAFTEGHVAGVESVSDASVLVQLDQHERPVRARIAVVATGASVQLVAKLGGVRRQAPSALALRCYVRSPYPLDRLIISYDRSILPGYAWIFPLPGGEFNVGCGCRYENEPERANLRVIFQRFMRDFPIAAEMMREAVEVGPLRGAMLRCGLEGVRPRPAPNVLVAGETIGATFPLTGEGIGKAMETGELAAAVADEAFRSGDVGRLAAFEDRLAHEVAPRFRAYGIAERWLSQPWLIDLFARRIRASRSLSRAVSGIVDESVDPRTVFSIGGLARSLVG